VNKKQKILITGSSGTIGTRLCEKLMEMECDILGVDYVRNKWNNEVQKVTMAVDLRNKEELSKLPVDFDMIVHLAANARVYNLVVEPSLAMDNMITTFNILEFARLNNIKKFVFASSREVYGNSREEVHSELEVSIDNCESPYTASKITGEALVQAYHKCFGMDFLIFRFSNVYGMYDDSDRLVPLFIKQSMNNEDLVVFGKEKLLDFTYIDDTVAGVVKGLESFDAVKDNVFNIAYGEGTKILDIAKVVKSLLGSKSRIILKDNRPGEVVKYVADTAKARKLIGYSPKVAIEDGLKKSVEWYKNYWG